MKRVSFLISVFVLGIAVAVALAYLTRNPTALAIARTHPAVSLSPKAPLPLSKESIELSDSLFRTLQKFDANMRLGYLVDAVRSGTLEGASKLNGRTLALLSDYRERILPVLKREALLELLSRFREIDWSNWQLSSFAKLGGPTAARAYVDQISIANPELGRFLETSAEIFSELWQTTHRSEIFNAKSKLLFILAESERDTQRFIDDAEASARSISREKLLDASILEDPVFVPILNSLKSRLVFEFIDGAGLDPLIALEFMLSVDVEYLSVEHERSISQLLRRFSTEASPKYREVVFNVLASSTLVHEVSERLPVLRRALAELYLTGSMDAYESKDYARAKVYLAESSSLLPGLKTQELMSKVLDNLSNNSQISEPIDHRPARNTFISNDGKHANTFSPANVLETLVSYLSLIIFVLVVTAALFFLFIYVRSVKAAKQSSLEFNRKSNNYELNVTSPSTLDFEDNLDSDLRRVASGL